jgi:hypothetical protein
VLDTDTENTACLLLLGWPERQTDTLLRSDLLQYSTNHFVDCSDR